MCKLHSCTDAFTVAALFESSNGVYCTYAYICKFSLECVNFKSKASRNSSNPEIQD